VEKPPFRFKRMLIIALLALIVVMLGLVMLINYLPVAPGTFEQMRANATLDASSTNERFTYDVTSRMVDTTLQITLVLDGGSASWTFTDPAGEVRWEGQLETGQRLEEARSFAPIAGLWTLVLNFQEASGEYTLDWHGIH
jgi:hypothetical protein